MAVHSGYEALKGVSLAKLLESHQTVQVLLASAIAEGSSLQAKRLLESLDAILAEGAERKVSFYSEYL
jgi:hypothetical protein